MSRIKEQVILRSKSNPQKRASTGFDVTWKNTKQRGHRRSIHHQPGTSGPVRLIRKVLHLEWVTNAIPIKLTNRTWKVQMDYSGLNKACAKDMYPFLEEEEELASLMGYPYKCFLQPPKEYNQIKMVEEEEEKTGFHTEEGVYCFTHMPKELNNFAATL
nr:reverse transcriptase domain-containing protein [Tanacetum cinerariifolium]